MSPTARPSVLRWGWRRGPIRRSISQMESRRTYPSSTGPLSSQCGMVHPRAQLVSGARRAATARLGSGRDLLETVDDSSSGEIVRGELDGDLVTAQDADEVLAHLARNVCQHHMAIF